MLRFLTSRSRTAMALSIIAVLVYINTLWNGFVLDDVEVITNNAFVNKGISGIPEILSTTYHRGFIDQTDNLYRPLSLVLFAVMHQLSGNVPALFHLVSVLLFAGCVTILFLFLDELFDSTNTLLPFVTSLLFALHPIHTEVVANVKSCDELLCFLFGFQALRLFLHYTKSGSRVTLVSGILCYLAALLSKETALTFVLAIPLVLFLFRAKEKRRNITVTWCATTAALLFLAARYQVLQENNHGQSFVISYIDNIFISTDISLGSRLATAILIQGVYLKLLLVPYPLVCDYSYAAIDATNWSDPWVAVSATLLLSLIGIAIYRLVRRKNDPVAFGILFYFVVLVMFSNIFFLIGSMMSERFLFLPSVGFCLAISLLVIHRSGKNAATLKQLATRTEAAAILGILCLAYMLLTFNRNSDWKDNYSLFITDVRKSPNSAKLNRYAGIELTKSISRQQDMESKRKARVRAIDFMNRALEIYPDFYQVHEEVGLLYMRNDQLDEAAAHELAALRLYPNDTFAINLLSKIYFRDKKYNEAIRYSSIGLLFGKDKLSLAVRLGASYAYLQKYDSAIHFLNYAALLDPGDNTAYVDLAGVYRVLGKGDSAAKYENLARAAPKKTTSGY